ncbi:MAG TPA: hypothetical protein VJB57_08230 [Dehalococcoidia bacterium]|nr:hypothetical protein [Dehalococcoidia bacterium]
MADYTRVEVEPNDNCPMSAFQVYRNMGEPFPVKQVRLFEGGDDGRVCDVTGWASEDGGRPSEAYAVRVEDSSAGVAYLIYGGDWGIRLAPAPNSGSWDLGDSEQWGETHLVLADIEDIDPK